MRWSITAAAGLLLGSSGVLAQKQLGWNHSPVERDNEAISENYPDVDVELLSPAFIWPETVPEGFANGTAPPTPDATLHRFLRSLADRNDWLTYHTTDFRSEEGRVLPYLVLTDPSADAGPKLRVYIQGGIHGNEPASEQGVLALLGALDADQDWAASVLERLEFLILPRYNTDGYEYFQRELASNLDPNREHIKLARRQSQDIKRLVSAWDAHVIIDSHEFTASRLWAGQYRHGQDAQYTTGRNLNTHPSIGNLTETLFNRDIVAAVKDKHGYRLDPYVTGQASEERGSPIVFEEAVTNPNSGRNAYGLTQAVAVLLEIRGIRLADQHFHRRVAVCLALLEELVNTAVENADHVYETIETARDDFINGNDDIILTDSQPETNATFTLVDVDTGALADVPVTLQHSSPAKANLTRSRPEAYLIPRNWADVADKLEAQGLEVETIPHAWEGAVEALTVTSQELAPSLFEGRVLRTVETETAVREVYLQPGSFRVSTRQKNAAVAFVSLEPEVPSSFASFGSISLEEGDEYPIFREVV